MQNLSSFFVSATCTCVIYVFHDLDLQNQVLIVPENWKCGVEVYFFIILYLLVVNSNLRGMKIDFEVNMLIFNYVDSSQFLQKVM